ncbi:MAG: hypothetical protein HY219_00430 [Candidatus Staskawiczbacteria bacterium]|nr:hypothetical protein [Candidatus Staskawiczbacteria bacterium]
MINKIIGYALLVAGLLLIIFTLYQSYGIFTGSLPAPLMFSAQGSAVPASTGNIGSLQDLQKQLNNEISKQISQMIPADSIPKMLNLISWSVLAGILIFGGGQIAGLGVKMIK